MEQGGFEDGVPLRAGALGGGPPPCAGLEGIADAPPRRFANSPEDDVLIRECIAVARWEKRRRPAVSGYQAPKSSGRAAKWEKDRHERSR